MPQGLLVSAASRYILAGFDADDRTCKRCGVTINEKTGRPLNVNHAKKTFIYDPVCKYCRTDDKKIARENERPTKESLRLLRKAAGIEDWHDDNGAPCEDAPGWDGIWMND